MCRSVCWRATASAAASATSTTICPCCGCWPRWPGSCCNSEQLVAEQTGQLEARNAVLAQALNTQHRALRPDRQFTRRCCRRSSELERVSLTQATVLLLGESGTGKELFARAVHLASGRRDQPFIKVNCSAIPDTLFESELFGYERGAFTGASTARAGWFEQANGGTIFLDEIGELPLAMQSKLLRTLQEGTLVRLGGKRELRVNVRLVAATNRDLAREVDRRALPPGPVLPAQRHPDPACPVPARAARGHPRAGAAFCEPRQPGAPAQRQPGAATRWRGWKTTPGPATSANSATSSSAWCCWPTVRCSRPSTWSDSCPTRRRQRPQPARGRKGSPPDPLVLNRRLRRRRPLPRWCATTLPRIPMPWTRCRPRWRKPRATSRARRKAWG
jgi:hypothetical protein